MKIIAQKPSKKFLPETSLQSMDLWITRKYRGFTGIAEVEKGKLTMRSGNSVSTFNMPQLEILKDGIYVGEIYTPDIEDENNLQEAINKGNYDKIRYAMFDVLSSEGKDLTNAPLRERIKYIDVACGNMVHKAQETKARDKDELMAEIIGKGWEGIVAADMNGIHRLNLGTNGVRQRGDAWKLKPSLALEFIVCNVNEQGVAEAKLPGDKTGRTYKFGSYVGTLDPHSLQPGNIIEVTFCSIDRQHNFVHPVVRTVRRPEIDLPGF